MMKKFSSHSLIVPFLPYGVFLRGDNRADHVARPRLDVLIPGTCHQLRRQFHHDSLWSFVSFHDSLNFIYFHSFFHPGDIALLAHRRHHIVQIPQQNALHGWHDALNPLRQVLIPAPTVFLLHSSIREGSTHTVLA